MDKDEKDNTEFHIEEYECGQKVSSYRMGDRHQRLQHLTSSKKSRSSSSLGALCRACFFPENYPLGVSSDYSTFQFYNIAATGCIAISGALAFSILFRGLGVGQSTTNSLVLSIVWLLKDGAGMIGRIIFAWILAAFLDADCKRWHYVGDILNNLACVLDIITPFFPSLILLISSISNICRAVTLVIHGSTRAVIFQHQARDNNVADVTAKCSSQEQMVSLVALVINVLLLSTLPTSIIGSIFIVLTCGNLWMNYLAKRSILFAIFNNLRFHLVCWQYFQTNGKQILSIDQVNKQEPILFLTSPIPYRSHLGISFHSLPDTIDLSPLDLQYFHQSESDRFLLIRDKKTNHFYALLKPQADTNDLLRLNFYIEILAYAAATMNKPPTTTTQGIQSIIARIQKQFSDLNACIDILREDDDKCYEQFRQACLGNGYNLHRCLFNIGVFRIQ